MAKKTPPIPPTGNLDDPRLRYIKGVRERLPDGNFQQSFRATLFGDNTHETTGSICPTCLLISHKSKREWLWSADNAHEDSKDNYRGLQKAYQQDLARGGNGSVQITSTHNPVKSGKRPWFDFRFEPVTPETYVPREPNQIEDLFGSTGKHK